MRPVGFEPTGERSQTCAFEQAANGAGVMASVTSDQAWSKGLDAGTYCE